MTSRANNDDGPSFKLFHSILLTPSPHLEMLASFSLTLMISQKDTKIHPLLVSSSIVFKKQSSIDLKVIKECNTSNAIQ